MERYKPERSRVRSATSRRANCSCCCIRLSVREAAATEITMRTSSPRNAPSNTQRKRWEGQSGSGEAVAWDTLGDVFIGNGRQGGHYHYPQPRDWQEAAPAPPGR